MAKFNWRDPLAGLREAAIARIAEDERDDIKAQARLDVLPHAIDEAIDYARRHPDQWAGAMEAHQTEINWRNRQNWYDVTGKAGAGYIDETARRNNVQRSRRHYVNNPMYSRAVNLSADFIYGKGLGVPRPTDIDGAEAVADKVVAFWNDPLVMRVLTGSRAQIDRCRQLLIDGEVPWMYSPGAGTAGIFWPLDALDICATVEHPTMPGVPLLYKRNERVGVGTREAWYWSTDARSMVAPEEYQDVKAKMLAGNTSIITEANWADAKLDESFGAGPYIFLWSWTTDPMGTRGHPPFFSALDWGEMNVGLAGNLQTYVRSITAITYKIRGKMTADDISDLKTALKSTLSLTTPPPATGTWRVEGTGQEMTAMDVPTGGATLFQTAFEVSRLMIAAATGLSVHWLGDPSTGNLATATAMELPQLKMFEGWQRWFMGCYDEMFRIITRQDGNKDADVRGMVELDFPELASRDVNAMIQALATAKNANMVSDEDAARQTALQLGEEDVEQFVKRVLDNIEEQPEELTQIMESQPQRALGLFRRAIAKIRERDNL